MTCDQLPGEDFGSVGFAPDFQDILRKANESIGSKSRDCRSASGARVSEAAFNLEQKLRCALAKASF
jgi:hypothetical protein